MGAAISHTVRQGRHSSQVQQYVRLLTSYGQRPPDPRQCMLINMPMTACLQQQSTLCTEAAFDVSNSNASWPQLPKAQPKELMSAARLKLAPLVVSGLF
ncbi:hypothetical protein WJX77_000610 [Trebouxia sp. C0004]